MKPIKKRFTKLGNSVGVVVDKILLKESEINENDELEVICRKGYITIKKSKQKEN